MQCGPRIEAAAARVCGLSGGPQWSLGSLSLPAESPVVGWHVGTSFPPAISAQGKVLGSRWDFPGGHCLGLGKAKGTAAAPSRFLRTWGGLQNLKPPN